MIPENFTILFCYLTNELFFPPVSELFCQLCIERDVFLRNGFLFKRHFPGTLLAVMTVIHVCVGFFPSELVLGGKSPNNGGFALKKGWNQRRKKIFVTGHVFKIIKRLNLILSAVHRNRFFKSLVMRVRLKIYQIKNWSKCIGKIKLYYDS